METRYSYLMRFGLLLGDFYIVNACYAIAYLTLGQTISMGHTIEHIFSRHFLFSNIVIFNLGWLTLSSAMKLYTKETVSTLEQLFRQTIKTIVLHGVFFLIILSYSEESLFAVKFLPICYGSMITLFAFSRFFITYLMEFIFKKAKLHTRIAIVGHNETGMRLAEYFLINQNVYSFEGFFDDREDALTVDSSGRMMGRLEECIHFAAANNIREIYSTILPEEHMYIERLMEVADQNCVRMKFVPHFSTALQANYHIEYFNALPIISVRTEPLQQDIGNLFKKWVFDIVFSSLVLLLIMSWLVPIIALIIKLESKGPVFFRQQRTGRDNQPFWCYKFRSMTINQHSDHLQASRNDQRITKVGAFLRKTSLDELPQFFNVLIGHMSVVGPRPHMLKHTEEYSALISRYMVRQFLKPGITGWAQVNGYRGETKDTEKMAKRVEYDIYYMENWSWMMDVKIIFMTIISTVKGDQNAF
jgi:putative colanic acid biosynthesis UDP-glucose lipid carrier transferase